MGDLPDWAKDDEELHQLADAWLGQIMTALTSTQPRPLTTRSTYPNPRCNASG